MSKQNKYQLTSDQYKEALKKMLLIRKFEEKCSQLYGRKEIGGFCHLYIGQEAVVTGLFLAKQKNDSTITAYRCHGHAILSGVEPKYVLVELLGKKNGCSKGKGGSMHLFNKEGKFYGGHGIVGAQIPLGTGIAFAHKYKGDDNFCFASLGDGAINQGQIYEAFNMAQLWNLPIIYIIENNQYSMGTSIKRSTAYTELYKKGESFGISGIKIDGMDIDEIYGSIMQAREDKKPFIIETRTYRYRGHSMSDPALYRTKQEVEDNKKRDPISLLEEKLLKEKHITESQIKIIKKDIKDIIIDAEQYALTQGEPDKEELYKDIFK